MIEPFHEGEPGPHVIAGVEAARNLGFSPEMGPFGTAIEGDASAVIEAVGAVLDAARRAGALRVSLQVDYGP